MINIRGFSYKDPQHEISIEYFFRISQYENTLKAYKILSTKRNDFIIGTNQGKANVIFVKKPIE